MINLREMFLDVDNVNYGLKQAYSKLKSEGLDSYTLMGIGDGGKSIAKGLNECGFTGKVLLCSFENEKLLPLNKSDIIDEKILVCEDSTITGKSFKKTYDLLRAIGADDVKLFSFLMRRDSSFVPNIFVFETEKDTKVYFPWSDYPIRIYSKGIVRKMTSSDTKKKFKCGDPRIDSETLLTRLYEDYMVNNDKVYLVEDKYGICSFIKFHEKTYGNYTGLFLKMIATAKEKQGQKYGDTLIKLILNYMFYHEFDFISGYALDDAVNMYKNIDFEVIGSLQDDHYGKLHKVATVHTRKKTEKDLLIATLKSSF